MDIRYQLEKKLNEQAAIDPKFRKNLKENPKKAITEFAKKEKLLITNFLDSFDIRVTEEGPKEWNITLYSMSTAQMTDEEIRKIVGAWGGGW